MVRLISNFMLVSTESQLNVFFSCTLKTCMFNHSTRVLIVTGLLGYARALSQVACIVVNTLQVLIARYVFTRVCCVHYLSSINSPVKVRIGNHTRKGRGLILLVTLPAKINHLSTNYTEFYFCSYLPFRMQYPISANAEKAH